MDVPRMMSRYKIKSRASLYNRMKFLEIELLKSHDGKAFATQSQLMLLDRLHEHISRGNKMSTFDVMAYLDTVFPDNSIQADRQQTRQIKRQEKRQTATSKSSRTEEEKEVVININQPKSVVEKHSALEECYQNEWLLTTKEVEEILNRRPRKVRGEEYCVMNGWKFVVRGKDRSQYIWQVQRMDD